MADARSLLRAAHLPPTLVVTTIGAALAAGAGASPGRVALVAVAVLAGQLSVGWSNDWIDAPRDRRAGRWDKPTVTTDLAPTLLRSSALTALAACVPLSLALGVLPGALHLAGVGLAWAYNARLKATAWSWLPYAGAFALLPAAAVLAAGRRPAGWVLLAGALLGTGAHVANVLPDLDDDVAAGVRGLPHRIGRRPSGVLAPGLLLAGCAVALLGSPVVGVWQVLVGLAAAGAAVAAGVVVVRAPHSRAPFALSMATALACVVLVVAGAAAAGRG